MLLSFPHTGRHRKLGSVWSGMDARDAQLASQPCQRDLARVLDVCGH